MSQKTRGHCDIECSHSRLFRTATPRRDSTEKRRCNERTIDHHPCTCGSLKWFRSSIFCLRCGQLCDLHDPQALSLLVQIDSAVTPDAGDNRIHRSVLGMDGPPLRNVAINFSLGYRPDGFSIYRQMVPNVVPGTPFHFCRSVHPPHNGS